MIHLSNGNTKLGSIFNISLPPFTCCRPDAPCMYECYADKAYRQYKSTRKAWTDNLMTFLRDPFYFFDEIAELVRGKNEFRWLVGGDIPNELFFQGIKHTCLSTPSTKHVLYTKRYDLYLDLEDIPENLSMFVSIWPGLELPAKYSGFRKAFYVKKDEGIPQGAHECPGSCKTCKFCWYGAEDVAFMHH